MNNPEITLVNYHGKNIRLRPLKQDDMQHTLRWRNDPEVREYAMGYRFPVTELMDEQWYKTALQGQGRNDIVYTIEHIESGTPIGLAYLKHIDWLHRTCDFGISIGEKQYHGKGYAQEVMQLLFNYAFNCINLRKICIQIVAYNKKAIGLYKKMGFKIEGQQKEQIYLNDQYHDLIFMALFRKDFLH